MSLNSFSENPGAIILDNGYENATITIEITINIKTPYVKIAEVNLFASSFLFCDRNSENKGIKEVERAPVIKIWNKKSGTRKAARNTPKSLDAPKIATSNRYLRIPNICPKMVVATMKNAAVKIFDCFKVNA